MVMKYDRKAAELQEMGRISEAKHDDDYDDGQLRRAIMYSREDLVMVVSHLSSANKQLYTIRLLLCAVVGLLAYLAVR